MIARIWKGRVRGADADEYTSYLRETGVAGYTTIPGNRGVWMLRRDHDDTTEFLMVTLWDSRDAVKAFAATTTSRPSTTRRTTASSSTAAPRVDHYEVDAFPPA